MISWLFWVLSFPERVLSEFKRANDIKQEEVYVLRNFGDRIDFNELLNVIRSYNAHSSNTTAVADSVESKIFDGYPSRFIGDIQR